MALTRKPPVKGDHIVAEPISQCAHETVHQLPPYWFRGHSFGDSPRLGPIVAGNDSSVNHSELL